MATNNNDSNEYEQLSENLAHVTSFISTRVESLHRNASKPTTGASKSGLYETLQPVRASKLPSHSLVLPQMVTETIKHIIKQLGIAEVAIKFPTINQVFVFTNTENRRLNWKKGPSKNMNYTFGSKKEAIGSFNVGEIAKYMPKNRETDARISKGLFKDNNISNKCLVLTSKMSTPFSITEDINKNCYLFFSLPTDEIAKLEDALDVKAHTSTYKMSTLLDYRVATNLITCVLAPSIKDITRYSRYPLLKMFAENIRDSKNTIDPPWYRGHKLPTITLVLDIRKSTFSMTYSLTQKGFADWMKIIIQSLRQVADKYGAIFDKFTGDGVMVHFASLKKSEKMVDMMKTLSREEYQKMVNEVRDLIDNSDYVFPDAAKLDNVHGNELRLLLAYCCGWEMLKAMRYHTERLDELLTKGHPKLGSTVGIGMGFATWSLDRDGNPIVVGPGVVGACRAVDSGKAEQMVTMPVVVSRLKKMDLIKEIPEPVYGKKTDIDADEQYYCLTQPPSFEGLSECKIHKDLQGLYREWDEPES